MRFRESRKSGEVVGATLVAMLVFFVAPTLTQEPKEPKVLSSAPLAKSIATIRTNPLEGMEAVGSTHR